MTSTKTMVDRLEGLLDTDDLSVWEHEFVTKMVDARDDDKLHWISSKQAEALERLHNKHFAG